MKELLLSDVLELSVEERIELAQLIWESVVDVPEAVTLSPEDREELDRRLEAYRADPTAGSPWSEVKARLVARR